MWVRRDAGLVSSGGAGGVEKWPIVLIFDREQ